MSWAEVFKINSNMTKPLNTLISELISGVTTLLNTVNTNVTTVNTNVTNTKTLVGTVNTAVGNVNTAVSTSETNVKSAITSARDNNNSHVTTKTTEIKTQLKEMKFQPIKVITATGTYTPEKTGTYKVICVGKGGDGNVGTITDPSHVAGGGGGGVAIKTMSLSASTTYNVTVSSTASFGNILTATAGSKSSKSGSTITAGAGGTASGGDYNYNGEPGEEEYLYSKTTCRGGSVGVTISDLSRSYTFGTPSGMVHMMGDCLLKYGGGGAASLGQDVDNDAYVSTGFPAAVIIIPIE